MIMSAPARRRPWMTLRPMPPSPKTIAVDARLDLGGVDHGADARRHAAADVADLVERRGRVDLGDGDLGQHGVIGEGRAAHVVVELLPPSEKRDVPSGITPWPWVARIAVQRLVLRDRQEGHSRHSGV